MLAQWGSYVEGKGIGFGPQRRCVSTCPLWFRANSGLLRPLLGGRLGCGQQRRTRWGGAFVSMLPLWFRANPVAFRRSRCGFARIPLAVVMVVVVVVVVVLVVVVKF